ncbi:DUF1667 domain-containing protein [Senegalia massiliensis]|jgi:CxxC motif-containing protein|uniref:DUF1667 domain-containing protein n=1 Tax=Senegalia massiliensis TaxID=1720316 RepID=UPI0010301092|nr:DUF1667 domain-containing protein [Senegalia massiliensis]
MDNKRITCIVCPIGCSLLIEKDEERQEGYRVSGNKCKRGESYAIKEMKNPTRIITSTVKIKGGLLERLPVKTKDAIPKDKIFEIMDFINQVTVTAPINVGDIIIKNIGDTGVDLVSTRDMK